ncbi:MAG: hypothetical protein IPK10_18920 [Bacteroidetes bacterium]|nr:hypothetical protein [Bacteroidota bacterium]
MKVFLQILIGLLLLPNLNVDAQEIEWQKAIGGSMGDLIMDVIKFNDGFVLAGRSHSEISGDKTDPRIGHDDFGL